MTMQVKIFHRYQTGTVDQMTIFDDGNTVGDIDETSRVDARQ